MGRRAESLLTTASDFSRSRVAGYLAVILAVGATSAVVGNLQAQTRIYDASMLYLLVIVGGAIFYGLGPAVVAAFVGLSLFDWFLDPVGTLIPDGPAELLSLGLFLFVGIVTSQLAARQRQQAVEARSREQEALALYTLTTLLVSTNDPSAFLTATLRVFKRDLGIAGLALLIPDGSGALTQETAAGELRSETASDRRLAHDALVGDRSANRFRRRGIARLSFFEPDKSDLSPDLVLSDQPDSLYVAIHANDKPIGVLRVGRPIDASELDYPGRRFLAAIAQQAGISLERARWQQTAAETAALRRREELKTAVLNSVTHDLRTPLAMIKASAGSLRNGQIDWSDEERDAFAESIEKNADRLDGIVGNLLELSRIDAGMISPERQFYPLPEIVDDVVNRLRSLLSTHSVTDNVSDDLPPVPVDYVAIDRVLSNLLENAVHYTPVGTAIVVGATREGNEIIVSVADEGPGISPLVLPHVFDRFQRGRASRPNSRSGAGLGLAVVKGLVEGHGGRAWVESREGRGATFFFSLPLTNELKTRIDYSEGPYS